MHISTLRLNWFRNHTHSEFNFGQGINVLLGDNGHGKTNVIESISYLCLSKSFYAGGDTFVVNFDSDNFSIDGIVSSDSQKEYRIRVAYNKSQGEKVYTMNGRRVDPFYTLIGKFPVVICSHEHATITSGVPAERRKFVDFVISQSNTTYLRHLIDYRRVLRHRNKILLDAKISNRDSSHLLEPWDGQLIEHGSYLVRWRSKFIEEFGSWISTSYSQLIGSEETPFINYRPTFRFEWSLREEEIREALMHELRRNSAEEKRIGTTLVGPHRDDYIFTINDLDVRKYASQGQHKTFLVALKLGEFAYLKEHCGETPILLLDDVFSELDEHRAEKLLHLVESLSQTFITSTNPRIFNGKQFQSANHKTFLIEKGGVIERRTVAA